MEHFGAAHLDRVVEALQAGREDPTQRAIRIRLAASPPAPAPTCAVLSHVVLW